MRANYHDYMKLFDHLYCGKAMREPLLSENAECLRRYLVDGGAAETCSALGILFRTWSRNGNVYKRELCIAEGEDAPRPMTIREIQNIGLFLPGGPMRKAVRA